MYDSFFSFNLLCCVCVFEIRFVGLVHTIRTKESRNGQNTVTGSEGTGEKEREALTQLADAFRVNTYCG